MTGTNELIVLLMREFSWTYEYTRDLVRTMPLNQLNALVDELQYQRALSDYKLASYAAMIVACLASDKQHRKTVKDIIGPPPTRKVEKPLKQVAIEEGFIMPKED